MFFGVDEGERLQRVAGRNGGVGHDLADDDRVLQRRAVEVRGEDLRDELGRGATVVHAPLGRGLEFDHRLVGTHADAAHL